MQLRPEQLEARLRKQLDPLYFISGDEPLRVLEAADAVRRAAQSQGYSEREVMTVQAGFDWDLLACSADSLSLFAERRVVDLRLPTGKPGDAGARALRAWAERPPEDTLLLVTSGKLEPAARKSKWLQALDAAGVVVQVWPLQVHEFHAWVQARMRRHGLEPTREAVALLAERVEGNLLACVQEIDKLYLLRGAGPVAAEDVLALVADNARYDVYGLVDSALAGQAARSVHMLHGLDAEGTPAPVVLWALAREIRQLAAMAALVAGGRSVRNVLDQYRVWENRRPVLDAALKRLPVAACNQLLRQCAFTDRVCKGQAAGNAWSELLQLTLQLAGQQTLAGPEELEQVS
jgi:DNA polymerase-3 subunit delta